jgi:hypothetical protein
MTDSDVLDCLKLAGTKPYGFFPAAPFFPDRQDRPLWRS